MRDVGVLAFRTPGKTTARHDSDKRLTIAPSITYLCCNIQSNRNAAPRRTTLAPEKCDLPVILRDTAQPCINTARKGCRHSRNTAKTSTKPPRRFDAALRPTITYFIDNKEGYGVDHRLPPLLTNVLVFQAELFGVQISCAIACFRQLSAWPVHNTERGSLGISTSRASLNLAYLFSS